jgi:cytoskeletal protein CcmA (bactofilin family)
MAQQIIDFGSFPNDPAADPIRAAFQKVQNNFTELYQTTLSTGVIEIVAGVGLDQNRTQGNVSMSANISNIRLSTGSSNSLVFGTSSSPTDPNVVVTTSTLPIYVDLAPSITTANANFTGSLKTANFSMTGFVTSSLLPGAQDTYNLGSPSRRWKDLYLSGTTLTLGTVPVQSDGTSIIMPNVTVTSNIAAGNVVAGSVSGNLTTAVQSNITSVGTLATLSVSANVTAGNMNVSGSFAASTIYGNIVLPPGATIDAPGSNMQVLFNDSGKQSAVPGLAFDRANTLLTIQGNIASGNLITTGNANISGNATITGNIGVNKVVASGNIEGSNIVTLGILASQTGISTGANLAISSITTDGTYVTVNFATQTTAPFNAGSTVTITGVSPSTYNGSWTVVTAAAGYITFASTLSTTATVTSARIKGNGNTAINGVLEVVGNTSMGNITAVNSITGNSITLSGNVDSENLIASGIIRVTGTANLGAVFSPGDSNVANSIVRGSFGATGAATFAGTITAETDASFYGGLLANSTMSINGGLTANSTALFNGLVTANSGLSVTGSLSASNASIGGFSITSGGNASGNIFTATLFSGNGASLTFVNGSNISGVVANANYTVYASSAVTSDTATLANNIRQGSYSNITGVGTLTSLTVGGDFSVNNGQTNGNLTITNGYLKLTINNAVSANGATLPTATQLGNAVNIITSVATGTGVKLPAAMTGVVLYVINDTNSGITVFPSSGQYIDTQAQNAGFNLGAYARMSFVGGTTNKWYTMTSVYA